VTMIKGHILQTIDIATINSCLNLKQSAPKA
jgi:hypothetical protein